MLLETVEKEIKLDFLKTVILILIAGSKVKVCIYLFSGTFN